MAVALGGTFLTESRSIGTPEPEAMTRVREEHSRLQGVVISLNQKISQVLAKQESDFLTAYRAHMYTVQKELQTLRQRVVEAENVLQKNDKVQKLEDECDWYRKEALRLDSFNTAMKKDLKYMKGKLEVLEDDRNWLARQLKACKKQDKVLRAELGLSSETAEGIVGAITAELSGKCASTIHSSQSQHMLSGAMTTLNRVRRGRHSESSPVLSRTEQLSRCPPRGELGNENAQKESYPPELLTKRVRMLERKLAKEQKELARVRATKAKNAVERAEMEDFFLQCIEDVRRNIEQRKRQGRALHARTAGPTSRNCRSGLLPRESSSKAGGPPSSAPEAVPFNTALEDFMPSDRRAVVESLLQREDVVAHLFDMFFPVTASNNVVVHTSVGDADSAPGTGVGNEVQTSRPTVTT